MRSVVVPPMAFFFAKSHNWSPSIKSSLLALTGHRTTEVAHGGCTDAA
ncbi:MAG: hypothetical protein JWR13_4819, partial [Mycobacterium sp.]|nr:hypothetical protein [Mycobacterium sp.]